MGAYERQRVIETTHASGEKGDVQIEAIAARTPKTDDVWACYPDETNG